MIRYFLKRLAGAIPTLMIIVTLAFFLVRVAPGGPFDQEQTLPPEINPCGCSTSATCAR
jgi:oligopeptide transport system permease protein